MSKNHLRPYNYHIHVRTYQERKANCKFYNREDKEVEGYWARGRRSSKYLIDSYDDKPVARRGRGWKQRGRQHQYYLAGSKQNSLTIWVDNWSDKWTYTEFFDKHNIPYKVAVVHGPTKVSYWYERYEKKIIGSSPVIGVDGKIRGYKRIYVQFLRDKPIEHKYIYRPILGYRIKFWRKFNDR